MILDHDLTDLETPLCIPDILPPKPLLHSSVYPAPKVKSLNVISGQFQPIRAQYWTRLTNERRRKDFKKKYGIFHTIQNPPPHPQSSQRSSLLEH